MYLITKSNWGGAQKYVFDLAVAAKAQGYEVSVACGMSEFDSAQPGPLVAKLRQQGIPVHFVSSFNRDISIFNDFRACFEIISLIRKIKPDVLHINSSKAGGIGALAGRLTRLPKIIFTSHGLPSDETWRPAWQIKLIRLATWLTIVLSHHIITISTPNFNELKSIRGATNKLSLIHNGVSAVAFIDKAKARKELAPQVPPRAFWFGGIGELCENKNWSAAIKAVSALPDKIHLVIVGEGDQRTELEKLIIKLNLSDRVHLLGFVDAAKYIQAFDVFILPSKKEGLPYVLLEAGMASLAVVASDLPGNRDIIESGQSGFLITPTPELISTTVHMLFRDEGMRRSIGEQLRETIDHKFSTKEMLQKTLALYSSNKS